jgi:hypothetical protein
MNRADRQNRIIEYLKIKPSSSGEVATELLRPWPNLNRTLSPERYDALKQSLTQQGSNLIPLLIRRAKPDDQGREYEVIYGEDWWQVATDLEIDRLWVWVFDLDDAQAAIARAEMQRLANPTDPPPTVPTLNPDTSPPALSPSAPSVDHRQDPLQTTLQTTLQAILPNIIQGAIAQELTHLRPLNSTPTPAIAPNPNNLVAPLHTILQSIEQRLAHIETMQRELGDRLPKPPTQIPINQATRADLEASHALNKRQIDNFLTYRQQHGDFGSLSQVAKVPTIGPSTLTKLREHFTD